jgi:hypothetical protein
MTKHNIEKIISRYDSEGDELDQITDIGKRLANLMRTCEWMRWTKFPIAFENCRTESDLLTTKENFVKWLNDTNLFPRLLQDNPDYNPKKDKKRKKNDNKTI